MLLSLLREMQHGRRVRREKNAETCGKERNDTRTLIEKDTYMDKGRHTEKETEKDMEKDRQKVTERATEKDTQKERTERGTRRRA